MFKMRSKALIITVVALVLLISSGFGQTQSTFTSTSGEGSTSQSSSSASSTGTSTSSPQQEGATPQQQQQQQVSLPTETRQVQAFSAVALCAPINLRILPNTTSTTPENAYAFTISAEQDVLDKIQADVDAATGVLSITAMGPFSTNQTVQLTASLPHNALNSITHSGPNAAIYVAPGYNVSSLNVTTTFGAGDLYLQDFSAERLNIGHHGIGNLIAQGQFTTVTASSDSIAALYISGVQDAVQLTLSSTSDAFIGQTASSIISGTAAGLNIVTYTAGKCQMTSPFSSLANLALATCTQQAFLSIPPPQPTWTCGIQVQGNFTCRTATVLALGPGGTAVSQPGALTITSTAPGGFFSSGATAQEGSQVQAGQAQPGSASALAGIAGTGSVSSSASSTSGVGGSSSTTQTTQNGVTQGFTTTSGGQPTQRFGNAATGGGTASANNGSPGVLVSYEGPSGETASAASVPCAAPVDATRMPLSESE